MPLISPCTQPMLSCICLPLARQAGYLMDAKKNVEDMTNSMEDLKAKRNDIQIEIEDAKREKKQATHEVTRWLQKVEGAEGRVASVTNQYERIGCRLFGDFSLSCFSRYRIGKKASKLLEKVMELKREGADFDVVTKPLPPERIQEIPSASIEGGTALVNLEKILSYLSDDTIGIVGIWGMGGIGKTALLQAINNNFLRLGSSGYSERMSFDIVIWLVASRELNLQRLQKDIAARLGLPMREDSVSQASDIFNFLKHKDFLLLLDDLWEAVELKAVGIPDPHGHKGIQGQHKRKRKVVLTTRSERVCAKMNADRRVKLQCLGREEAWHLFKQNVGEEILDSNPVIQSCARKVVKECGGLPLSLIVIGRALSTKRTTQEWDYAVASLKKSQPSIIPGMEDSLFPNLKFSYDSLQDDRIRECFLCCSLWPEDFRIRKDELITSWIGLALIDGFDNICEAYDHGHFLIGILIEACLLEPIQDSDEYIKMHDVIRDLALWIASDCGNNRNRWIVKAGVGPRHATEVAQQWRAKSDRRASWTSSQLPRSLNLDSPTKFLQRDPQRLLAMFASSRTLGYILVLH